MSNQPRFEVAHRDAGWYGRFIAANGREVWRTSDPDGYKRREGVINAIDSLLATLDADLEIRELDERTPDPEVLPPEDAAQAVLRMPIPDSPEPAA